MINGRTFSQNPRSEKKATTICPQARGYSQMGMCGRGIHYVVWCQGALASGVVSRENRVHEKSSRGLCPYCMRSDVGVGRLELTQGPVVKV